MSATTVGGLIGGAIDTMSGDDTPVEGVVIGAITANVLKFVLPIIVTYAVGWAVLRAGTELRAKVFGGPAADAD